MTGAYTWEGDVELKDGIVYDVEITYDYEYGESECRVGSPEDWSPGSDCQIILRTMTTEDEDGASTVWEIDDIEDEDVLIERIITDNHPNDDPSDEWEPGDAL